MGHGCDYHADCPNMLGVQDPAHLFEDLVNIEMVAMLNEAFCELHHKPYCPPSEELTRECGKVRPLTMIISRPSSWDDAPTEGISMP